MSVSYPRSVPRGIRRTVSWCVWPASWLSPALIASLMMSLLASLCLAAPPQFWLAERTMVTPWDYLLPSCTTYLLPDQAAARGACWKLTSCATTVLESRSSPAFPALVDPAVGSFSAMRLALLSNLASDSFASSTGMSTLYQFPSEVVCSNRIFAVVPIPRWLEPVARCERHPSSDELVAMYAQMVSTCQAMRVMPSTHATESHASTYANFKAMVMEASADLTWAAAKAYSTLPEAPDPAWLMQVAAQVTKPATDCMSEAATIVNMVIPARAETLGAAQAMAHSLGETLRSMTEESTTTLQTVTASIPETASGVLTWTNSVLSLVYQAAMTPLRTVGTVIAAAPAVAVGAVADAASAVTGAANVLPGQTLALLEESLLTTVETTVRLLVNMLLRVLITLAPLLLVLALALTLLSCALWAVASRLWIRMRPVLYRYQFGMDL